MLAVADALTVSLRVALGVTAVACSLGTWSLYRRSRDPNWVPWAFLSSTFAAYSAAILLLVTDSRLTIEDWWRPVFSLLNISVQIGAMWVLRRAVRHGW